MVRPITENDLGLEVLYDGTTEPDAHDPVDIVAVHGMGAHPDDTWCSQVPDQDPPAYVNWLKDKQFLPASVPHARIMRYGYSSQWFGKNATKTKMSDISQAFLFDLDEFREDKNRPLILIGHSFGGLVLLKTAIGNWALVGPAGGVTRTPHALRARSKGGFYWKFCFFKHFLKALKNYQYIKHFLNRFQIFL
ncbi:hypothetical protein RB598_006708 [Gaeumannomyces tritici]